MEKRLNNNLNDVLTALDPFKDSLKGVVVESTYNWYWLVERIRKRLEELPSKTINTSYVELSNLNWRMWDAHLTRKSLMFAKSFRWLKAKFSLCIAFYNFIRPHETLSIGEDRKFRPNTPAMKAGITEHP
jgi:hypothetical protein